MKYYFFIGTEAELIKLLPVLQEFENKKINFKIISSGQNDIKKSSLFKFLNKKSPDIYLNEEQINQNIFSYLVWFFKTLVIGYFKLRKEINKNNILIVHGDTLSTVMGAVIGRLYGMKVAHVEAGLRSYDFLHPFPEEINRYIVSHLSDIHFAPNLWALNNLKKIKGQKINTLQNTLIENTFFALSKKKANKYGDYFLAVIHRQENIYNKELFSSLINEIITQSKNMKCVFLIHASTKNELIKDNLYKKLSSSKNIILLERQDYFDFVNLINSAKFLLSDGGSNQEEAYYMGKPCLILRNVTERVEGLNENAVLFHNNIDSIPNFVKNYKKYEKKKVGLKSKPSKLIVNFLTSQNIDT